MSPNPNLNELNKRFAAIGLPVKLTAASAEKLKEAAPRDRLLRALTRAEQAHDQGARTYLDKTLRDAGIYPVTEGRRPEPASDSLPEPPPEPESDPETPTSRRQSQPDQPAAPRGSGERRAQRPQYHVYGGRAALTFELDETTAGVPTVALDGTHATGERQYDWSQKIRIQFTARELPAVAAVLLGVLPECTYTNHGPANDKGFSIAWQAERQTFFVKVWQGKGNLRAVPMPREDAFYVAQIVLRAIQQGSPARLDTTGTIACVRAFFGRA